MSVTCENCGYTNANDVKTCSNCYKEIVTSDEKKTKYKYIYPEKCSNCGAKIVG